MRIDRVVTSGKFELDGGSWDVDNNVWVVGDDDEVIVIDAAHQAEPIIAAVAGRTVRAIVCTHAHNDHINVAPQLAEALNAPIRLHPADEVLWSALYPGTSYEALTDHERISLAGSEIEVLHTPGHSPGAVSLHLPSEQTVFTGDTLFQGGPGATGRSFSSFPTIIESIRTRLLTLPEDTTVLTGHGDSTTIGAEAPHLAEWIKRGN
ncbi:metallo-beta-lactamase superfamily protein [Nocardia nova SH22a]|uniref:Metallo-beta-lactamase superfamily protein n=1 Tax=Nocardia nova SH22a TaxID=1415166 RepID=W5TCB3_9NOCA|nr:MBL fold metallo-hydrolase [Nocardia nova]AHH16834.1 metallo-beta-lactamase superfamily protein [Nocardia nova SH22a]